MYRAGDVETWTQRFGQEIFSRLEGVGAVPFSPAWLDDRLMEIGMTEEAVKVQLFRFVDVLPRLSTPADVARHLREYFAQTDSKLPRWLQAALQFLPSQGLAARLLAATANGGARRMARKFIAGTTVAEVLAAIARLRRRSLAFTVDLLGEATITEKEADAARDEYLELIAGLTTQVNAWPANNLIDRDDQGELPRVNVSVKLSALYSQFDPIDPDGTSAVVLQRLRPILHSARRCGVFVNIDMEQYAFKDLTLRIFRQVLEEAAFRDWPDVGIAMQAYLHDTRTDLHELAVWAKQRGTPVGVRLVKGAYWDYETILARQLGWPAPVFARKHETDANYERLTEFLLLNRHWLRSAFGSHNVRSLAHALALARVLDLPPRSFELQMLYGMADPIKDVLAGMGQRVRVYTPYGDLLPGMAYLVRRLLENTANESFLRASFSEHLPAERLLRKPAPPDKLANGGPRMTSVLAHPHAQPAPGRQLTSFQPEPVTDFSRDSARQAMAKSLVEAAQQLGRAYSPIVNGVPLETPAFLESLNPSHKRQVVGRVGRASAEQARLAVAAAAAAFPGWRDTEPDHRADYLDRTATVLRRRRFELAAWEVYECGKPWREADADVAEAIDFCAYYAREMRRLALPRRRDVPGEDNVYFYEPRGVAVVIAPWNFPLAILCGMTTAALVTGNPVVMKPAEQSAVVAAKLMEAFQEAGLPPGVVNYLPGIGEEVGPVLSQHPDVALVAFTGSRGVGLLLNRETAEMAPGQDHVKRLIAEMGGKNAIIVDDDADLDEATHGVVASAFGYQGQKCSACSRVLVPDGLHDAFLERLIEATRSLHLAPAEDAGCAIGPVIDEDAYRRILAAIDKGRTEARLAYAGSAGPLTEEGYFIAPHVFADVHPRSSLAQEEIFGPVLAVLRTHNLSHALEIANGTPYALTGGLYSRSPAHIARVRREFRVGNLYINRKITGALVDRQPFGGFKLSGIGSKAGGPDYLLQFLLPRTITENTLRRGFAPSVDDDGGGV